MSNVTKLFTPSDPILRRDFKIRYEDENGWHDHMFDHATVMYLASEKEAQSEAKYMKFDRYQIISVVRRDYPDPDYTREE